MTTDTSLERTFLQVWLRDFLRQSKNFVFTHLLKDFFSFMDLSHFSFSPYNLLISIRSRGREFHSLKKYILFDETQHCLNISFTCSV